MKNQKLIHFNHSLEDLSTYLAQANTTLCRAVKDENFEFAAEVQNNIRKMIEMQTIHLHGMEEYSSKAESKATYQHIWKELTEANDDLYKMILSEMS